MSRKLTYQDVPVGQIEISPTNVRKLDVQKGLDELARNIQELGLLQPVILYRKRGTYQLIVGQRRYLACRKLGWETIPALITTAEDEKNAVIRSFSENIHRLELKYEDKMNAAARLRDVLGSVRAVANVLGVSDQTVRNYLGYAAVPEPMKEMVDKGELSPSTAINIARKIADERDAVEIAKEVIEEPTRDRRKLIIDTASRNPGKSAPEIARIARKRKFRDMTLHLTPELEEALEEACHDYSGEAEDIALEALEQWLRERGYLE